MMRTIVMLATLLVGVAQAQPQVVRGSMLKKRAYQTYAPITLYVDPTGSDTNPCVASGAAACATFAGAMSKLPRFINHNVTIEVAAGTYNEAFVIKDKYLNANVTLTVNGTMVPATIVGGALTGSITSSSAFASLSPNIINDTGQSWTVGALKGLFLTITSGSLAGRSYPIVTNTATSISATIGASNPANGSTYAIETHGTIFSTAAGTTANQIAGNGGGSGTIALNKVRLVNTTASSTGLMVDKNSTVAVNLTSVNIAGVSTIVNATGSALSIVRGYGVSAVTGLSCADVNGAQLPNSRCTIQQSYFRGTTASTSLGLIVLGNAPQSSLSYSALDMAGTGQAVRFNAPHRVYPSYILVTCTNPTQTTGFASDAVNNAPSFQWPTPLGLLGGNLGVKGCTNGVYVSRADNVNLTNLAFDTVTNAVVINKGGKVDFAGTTPTFTGVTNELLLDGTPYTFATLTGLPAPQVISNSYGSTIIR